MGGSSAASGATSGREKSPERQAKEMDRAKNWCRVDDELAEKRRRKRGRKKASRVLS